MKLVLQSVCFMLLSWMAAAITVVLVALVLQGVGRSLSWFANPHLIIPLYAVPSFVSIAAVHFYWIYRVG